MVHFMKTHEDLIMALGGSTAVADALGYRISTVGAWKHRNKIPSEHWPEIVTYAKTNGIKISLEGMFKLKSGVVA